MRYTLSADEEVLTIYIDKEEQAELAEFLDNEDSADYEDYLEPLICNSELNWTNSVHTGDLISKYAPMLAFMDESGKVTHRWAYMNYEVSDLLHKLLHDGKVTFTGGSLE